MKYNYDGYKIPKRENVARGRSNFVDNYAAIYKSCDGKGFQIAEVFKINPYVLQKLVSDLRYIYRQDAALQWNKNAIGTQEFKDKGYADALAKIDQLLPEPNFEGNLPKLVSRKRIDTAARKAKQQAEINKLIAEIE